MTSTAQERQDNSEKFHARGKQWPSFSTSAAKTTLSRPEAAIRSLLLHVECYQKLIQLSACISVGKKSHQFWQVQLVPS